MVIKLDALYHLSNQFAERAQTEFRAQYSLNNEPISSRFSNVFSIQRLSVDKSPIYSESWKMICVYIEHVSRSMIFSLINKTLFLKKWAAVWIYETNQEEPGWIYKDIKKRQLCIPPWEQGNPVYLEIGKLVAFNLACQNMESPLRNGITIENWSY